MAMLMGVRTISPGELQKQIEQGAVVTVDVNAPGRWREAHVPGAINLNHETYAANDLPADRARLVVFYCSNPMCRKAPTAALRARKFGYENVRVMSAGITGWVNARMPMESGPAIAAG